jgi:hypothetical protein
MRILHVDCGREMRGGQWQVLRLMDGLRQAGVESTLLAHGDGPLLTRARALNLDARPFGLWPLFRLVPHADVVHAHDARAHTWGTLLGLAPLVVSRRVAFPVRSRWKYRRAARYAAVSEFVKQVMIEGGVPESSITVVYDGVPAGELARAGDRVVAPASDDPMKATDLAREAAGRAGVPLDVVSDLTAGLDGARLFVYLTRSEGLGSAVLVAMAAGVPVIVSNIGGLPEIVRHRENGWLVENAIEPVAAAISTLLNDRDLAQSLAARARQTVAERFSLDRMVQSTVSIYRQVLARPASL